MEEENKQESIEISEIKNENKPVLKSYEVEVIYDNTQIGGEIYQKGDTLEVTSLQGLEHFTKII